MGSRGRDAGHGRTHARGAAGKQPQRVEIQARNQVRLELRKHLNISIKPRAPRSRSGGTASRRRSPRVSTQPARTVQAGVTYVHSSHVAFISFPDLLHHLLLGSAAGFDGTLHRDGPLWVVQGQVLQTGRKSEVVNSAAPTNKAREPSYDEMVILVPVSCSIFFRLRPSFPINLPTKLLWTSIFSGISSVLRQTREATRLTPPHRWPGQLEERLLTTLCRWPPSA